MNGVIHMEYCTKYTGFKPVNIKYTTGRYAINLIFLVNTNITEEKISTRSGSLGSNR